MLTPDRKVTIIIPTKNHPSKLKRPLQYYISKRFQGQILIADQSSGRSAKATQSIVSNAKTQGLNIKIVNCLNQKHFGSAIRITNEYVKTPYVLATNDYDIAIYSGLTKCVEFLDLNSKYVAAGGIKGVQVQCGSSFGMHYTQCLEIETDYIAERLALYLRTRLHTINYLHRIEIWKEMFRYAHLMPNQLLAYEVLPSCISVMSGKIKDALKGSKYHAVFGGDDRNIVPSDLFDCISSVDYAISAKVMKSVVIQYLMKGGISQEQATVFYNRELWLSTLFVLSNKFVETFPETKPALDSYHKLLDVYPFYWRRHNLTYTLTCELDPDLLQTLTQEIYL